jgi:hypothetical protein
MTNAELRQELRNAIAARDTATTRRLALRLGARHTRTRTTRSRRTRPVLPPIRVAPGAIPGPPQIHVSLEVRRALDQLAHDDRDAERAAYLYGHIDTNRSVFSTFPTATSSPATTATSKFRHMFVTRRSNSPTHAAASSQDSHIPTPRTRNRPTPTCSTGANRHSTCSTRSSG